MLYVLLCTDKPDALSLRLDTRPAHVAYLDALNAAGKLKFAGPFLGGDGKPNGSLVMLEVADQAEAEAIASRDPYALAGLFATVEIRPFSWVFNPPAQG